MGETPYPLPEIAFLPLYVLFGRQPACGMTLYVLSMLCVPKSLPRVVFLSYHCALHTIPFVVGLFFC